MRREPQQAPIGQVLPPPFFVPAFLTDRHKSLPGARREPQRASIGWRCRDVTSFIPSGVVLRRACRAPSQLCVHGAPCAPGGREGGRTAGQDARSKAFAALTSREPGGDQEGSGSGRRPAQRRPCVSYVCKKTRKVSAPLKGLKATRSPLG